ncbi:MAG: hypothetical protein L6Q92_02815 [Phycisphaerae bacterium]|nr:hypothetical protein [Phycisphaerae bacterium]
MNQNAPETGVMIDSKTFAIGILTVTALILAVGIAVVATLPQPALAIGQTDRGGDYIMVTSQFNTGTELVYVVDGATSRMTAYAYDINRKQIVPWDWIEFRHFMRPPGGGR